MEFSKLINYSTKYLLKLPIYQLWYLDAFENVNGNWTFFYNSYIVKPVKPTKVGCDHKNILCMFIQIVYYKWSILYNGQMAHV
jgi:hypothetical protein